MTEARQRLLEAAYELFSRRGFAGTSMRVLARGAGTNNAAIVYHFGSKVGLYVAVMGRALEVVAGNAQRDSGWIENRPDTELPTPVDQACRLLAWEALDRRLPALLPARVASRLPSGALEELARAAAALPVAGLAATVARRAVAEPLERLLSSGRGAGGRLGWG